MSGLYARAVTDERGRNVSGADDIGVGHRKQSVIGKYKGKVKKAEIEMRVCFMGDCLSAKGGPMDKLARHIMSKDPEILASTPCHRGNKRRIYAISIKGTEYRMINGAIFEV